MSPSHFLHPVLSCDDIYPTSVRAGHSFKFTLVMRVINLFKKKVELSVLF